MLLNTYKKERKKVTHLHTVYRVKTPNYCREKYPKKMTEIQRPLNMIYQEKLKLTPHIHIARKKRTVEVFPKLLHLRYTIVPYENIWGCNDHPSRFINHWDVFNEIELLCIKVGLG